MSDATVEAMNALLHDLINRGGNRAALVWLSAGLGNAIGRYRSKPDIAVAALRNVRQHAAQLGVAKRLDDIIAMIHPGSAPRP